MAHFFKLKLLMPIRLCMKMN